ncbi:MAG TPA: ChaN family lipoprotein [Bacteroidales bacterium]|nr:ChaN family lipoprotein [Bacteroidales bacterium]
MMNISSFSLLLLAVLHTGQFVFADKPAYRLFDEKGKEVKYADMLQKAATADVVLFGEMHNNPICHWLQYELMRDIFESRQQYLAAGAEMFETDNQLLLDEYLSGLIRQRNFEAEAKLWPNYETDYKPLIEFAKENAIPFIATNVPRRYAAMVNTGGFEALDALQPEALRYIAPLPIAFDPELSQYRKMLEMMKGGMLGTHGGINTVKAQALKDATMAYFILKNLTEGKTFLHFNGTFHSDRFEGIMWYLLQARPELRVVTISSVESEHEDLKLTDDQMGSAHFILSIPATMTKTH